MAAFIRQQKTKHKMKQLTIIGNIGFDAVIKENNGNKFCEFSVAVNERFKKADGTQVETTDWINCSYRNIALTPYLRKGDKVMVQGNMKINVYQDKNKNYKAGVNLNVFNVQLLSSKKEEGAVTEGTAAPAAAPQAIDDLPF
jgi:single-strand DNA-binding protein